MSNHNTSNVIYSCHGMNDFFCKKQFFSDLTDDHYGLMIDNYASEGNTNYRVIINISYIAVGCDLLVYGV